MKRVERAPWIEGGALVGMRVNEQTYRFVGVSFRQSRATGAMLEMARYETHCHDCGEPMIAEVSVDSPKFEPSRRCRECARPGVAARPALPSTEGT